MQPHKCPPELVSVNGTCTAHDSVDLPICFTDTAILYGVCVLMWLLAGVEFIFRRHQYPRIPWNLVNISKLVSAFCIQH